MIQALKSLFKIRKEYEIEISWDNDEKETVRIKSLTPMNAIKRITKTKDVVNKADMRILNISSKEKIRYMRTVNLRSNDKWETFIRISNKI